MAQHNDLGKWGETFAADFLQKQGYIIRERDWQFGKRDIDIIALTADLTTLVFVEVKTRTNKEMVEPELAVTRQKIKSIGIAANNYIKQFDVVEEIRFDVITIVGSDASNDEKTIDTTERNRFYQPVYRRTHSQR